MKIIKFLTVLIALVLVGCGNNGEDIDLKIIAPYGTPALAQVYIEHYRPDIEGANYEIDLVSGADLLVVAFTSESHDIIFAPTNVGARLIDSGIPYVFAATVNWGNSYLASKTPIESLSDLEGKEVVAFGQNATPDIVLRTLIDNYSFENPPTIRYVDSVQSALVELVQDNTRIVLLAEPVLSVGQKQLGELNIIDLQDAWEDLSGVGSYPQAGVFIHERVPNHIIDAYLAKLEEGLTYLENNPELIAQYAVDLDYPFPKDVLVNAIPRGNIRFGSALESKEALEVYFNYILLLQGDLINNKLPDDSFYYNPE